MKENAGVFIDRPGGTLGLVFEVQAAVEAQRRSVTVEGSHVQVQIRRNPDAGLVEGFLGFPLVAEVYPNDGCKRDELIAAVASLNSALDQAGYDYVTDAVFEDRLPNQGRNVPIS